MIVWKFCCCVAKAATTAGSTMASLIRVSCCWDMVRFDDLISIVLRRCTGYDTAQNYTMVQR